MFGFFKKTQIKKIAHILYVKTVEQSRQPYFYVKIGVEDTLDGRFDLICLHMTLVIDRLDQINSEKSLSIRRALQEVFFDNMDLTLREMGVGDLSVGKKIKAMAEVFFGRMIAYQKAYRSNDSESDLRKIIQRNIFKKTAADENMEKESMILAEYILKERTHLFEIPEESFLKGDVEFTSL
jgi:cytochrome b pre-mRNA-processing protein 3